MINEAVDIISLNGGSVIEKERRYISIIFRKVIFDYKTPLGTHVSHKTVAITRNRQS